MAVLKEVLALFDLRVSGKKSMDAAERSTKRMEEAIGKLGAALTAGAIVGGLEMFTERVIHQTREMDLHARRLGITAQQMQALGLMGADAGVGIERVTDAMSTLQERMRDAVQDRKSDPAVQLRSLGIEIPRTMAEMPDAITLLGQASDGLAGMSNQTERVGAAMTVFGDVGRELLPVLQEGSTSIAAYTAELDALGGGFSQGVVEASREAAAAQARFSIVTDGLSSRLAIWLIPNLTRMMETLTSLASGFARLADRTHIMEALLVSLGAVAGAAAIATLIAWAPVIITVGFVAAAFAGVVLIIDDLLSLMSGGRSVIGGFVEELMGAGAAADLALFLSEAWWAVSNAARSAATWIAEALGQDVSEQEAAAERERETQQARRRELTLMRRDAVRSANGFRNLAQTDTLTVTESEPGRRPGPLGSRPATRGAGSLRDAIATRSRSAPSSGATVNAQTSVVVDARGNVNAQQIRQQMERAVRRQQDRQARSIRSALPQGGS